MQVDFDGIERRTMALPLPVRNYQQIINGPAGRSVCGEQKAKANGLTLQKFTLKEAEAKEYVSGAGQISVSADGKKMLARLGSTWKVIEYRETLWGRWGNVEGRPTNEAGPPERMGADV